MTIEHFYIPSDEQVGLTEKNSRRRAVYLSACVLCGDDYEVRDGLWLDTLTAKGTKIKVMVCKSCHAKESAPNPDTPTQ